MNFQDAGFPAPSMMTFPDHLSYRSDNNGPPTLRDSATTQFVNLHTELRQPLGKTEVNCRMEASWSTHRINYPCIKDLQVDTQGKTSITGLRNNSSGQCLLSSKGGVPKRYRTTFSPSQLNRLESEFRCSMYVVGLKRMKLAEELKLDERQVKIWFQNRRMKHKREQQSIQRKAAQFPQYYFY